MGRAAKGMRDFWDEAAKRNAAWYVDTTVSFDEPDMGAFFETGRRIVDKAAARVLRPRGVVAFQRTWAVKP